MKINNTTLLAIAGKHKYIESTKKALRHCLKQCSFDRVKLFSPTIDNEFEHVETKVLDQSLYSKFCVEELDHYIDTDYCLIVQWDGFIINNQYWNDEFFNYDYIGSPWASYDFTVGNGGFSLRSKRFLSESAKLKYTSNAHIIAGHNPANFLSGNICPEDFFLCYQNKDNLINKGISFAPPELAYQFSVEHQGVGYKTFDPQNLSTYKSFGFHGEFNVAAMKEVYHEN